MERLGTDLTRAKDQSVFSATQHEETRPTSSRASPKEELSYQLKIRESRQVIQKLRQEELEITEKLQKLKVHKHNISFLKCWSCLGACSRIKFILVISCSYSNKFPLHYWQLNRAKLEGKRKRTSSYSHGYSMCNTRENIEWRVREMENLQHCLFDLYASKRPHQRKDSDICSLDEKLKEKVSSINHPLICEYLCLYINLKYAQHWKERIQKRRDSTILS